ncbi:Wall-associated receptor kinase galacturonan-binding domain-containing protein [Cynara cardunculus var. scolymus]|uniref:Wall-associated receptor kinase galacturonan-binding domain-containing protein n=1 Tax=Cynara cardunculus var. scolymus TaxID=59895 RepID=A0A118JVP4_CYNCS|nr:Wall-associated receptor kinase galacturonan-binding domain-containing protein [Cynara cardunculus var. scolymus]
MKTLVLIWVLLQMFSLCITFDANLTSETYTLSNSSNLAKPNCSNRCGDLIVPYPFGIGNDTNCSISHEFDIYCDNSVSPPRASITIADYSFIKHISDSRVRISNNVASKCYFTNGTVSTMFHVQENYTNFPYTFSDLNKFTVIGCDDFAWMISETRSKKVGTGCMAFCSTPEDARSDQCSGRGCCQSSIPQDLNYYTTNVRTMNDYQNMSNIRSFNPCTYAFIGEENVFTFKGATDLKDHSLWRKIEDNVPIVLDWAIGNLSCIDAKAMDAFACQSNSMCVNSTRETGGYRCICNEGYEGNPYLSPGCQGTI